MTIKESKHIVKLQKKFEDCLILWQQQTNQYTWRQMNQAKRKLQQYKQDLHRRYIGKQLTF